jgi:hypothetical protein
MVNAAKRISKADPLFWDLQGRELALKLRANLNASASKVKTPHKPPSK